MQDGVYRLKADASLGQGLDLKAGVEIEIVNRVVYMGGYPLSPDMQGLFLRWITNNVKLFENVTMVWKKGSQNP
jgi:hypothetical protein